MNAAGKKPRLLLVSSTRRTEFDSLSTEEYFNRNPYSMGAILFNLEQMNWETCRVGLRGGARSPRKLARIIDQFRPDIICTYGPLLALNPLFARRLFGHHKMFKVVHCWDDVYGEIWRDHYGMLSEWFMNWMERCIIRHSDAVVTLSRYNQARGLLWGVVSEYIPNGCDHPDYDLSKCKYKLKGDLKLVYTGDQARWKRTADICEAMRHVPKNIKLYLTGRRYAYLNKYASDNCIFLGFVSKNDQWSIMSQADVLVSTSDQDCNAKLHEYLRMQKPILGYDGRANLLFRNGHNALLTRKYPEAIQRLFHEPELRKELVENSSREIPVYTWAEIAARYDEFFRRIGV